MQVNATEWPNFCECGNDVHHHLLIGGAKTEYKHLCDDCLYMLLVNRDLAKVVLSRGT